MKITRTSFGENRITLGKVLEGFEFKKVRVLSSNTLKNGKYIFELVKPIDKEKRHILHIERRVDEKGDLFEEPDIERMSNYIKFDLSYQVKNQIPDLVFSIEGSLDEGADYDFEAEMYNLIGEYSYAQFLKEHLVRH